MPTRPKRFPERRSGIALRLILFFLTLGLLSGAGLYAFALLGARRGPAAGPDLGPGSPTLSLPERLALSAYLQLRVAELAQPAGTDPAPVAFEVQPGETAGQVAARLAALGLIRDANLLTRYLRYNGLDSRVEAGRFTLYRTMTIPDVARAIGRARDAAVVLRIPEGWRAEQIAAALAPAGLDISPPDFLRLLDSRPTQFSFVAQIPGDRGLEGFLFPDTYTLRPEAGAQDVFNAMLADFEKRVTPEMRAAAAAQGRSLFEVVNLGAIIEREAVVADERPVIASVYLNRLALGMKLDADPTVQYAVSGPPDWWKRPLTLADLAFDSPYNTYLYPGLPPAPIANPGLSAIQAAIYPAQTTYLFFRARCDGSGRHDFSETYEEHLSKGC